MSQYRAYFVPGGMDPSGEAFQFSLPALFAVTTCVVVCVNCGVVAGGWRPGISPIGKVLACATCIGCAICIAAACSGNPICVLLGVFGAGCGCTLIFS